MLHAKQISPRNKRRDLGLETGHPPWRTVLAIDRRKSCKPIEPTPLGFRNDIDARAAKSVQEKLMASIGERTLVDDLCHAHRRAQRRLANALAAPCASRVGRHRDWCCIEQRSIAVRTQAVLDQLAVTRLKRNDPLGGVWIDHHRRQRKERDRAGKIDLDRRGHIAILRGQGTSCQSARRELERLHRKSGLSLGELFSQLRAHRIELRSADS